MFRGTNTHILQSNVLIYETQLYSWLTTLFCNCSTRAISAQATFSHVHFSLRDHSEWRLVVSIFVSALPISPRSFSRTLARLYSTSTIALFFFSSSFFAFLALILWSQRKSIGRSGNLAASSSIACFAFVMWRFLPLTIHSQFLGGAQRAEPPRSTALPISAFSSETSESLDSQSEWSSISQLDRMKETNHIFPPSATLSHHKRILV